MKIQKIDNTHFGALIKIKTPEEIFAQAGQTIVNLKPEQKDLFATASCTGLSSTGSGIMTAGSALNTAATTSDVIASANFLKASGINSFGIAPSAAAKSAPYLTPETNVSSNQHPTTVGSIFSTIGSYIHKYFKATSTGEKKIPS